MSQIITGVDIGNTKVATVICRLSQGNQVETLGTGMDIIRNVSGSKERDAAAIADSLDESVGQAMRIAGVKVSSAYFNISAQNSRVFSAEEAVRSANPTKVISNSIDSNKYVIEEKTGSISEIEELAAVCRLKIDGYVHEAIAINELYVPDSDKRGIYAIVNIAGSITEINIFKNDLLKWSTTIPVGGDNITKDIALILNIPIADAEKIKRKCNLCLSTLVENDIPIKIHMNDSEEDIEIRASSVVKIIEARVFDIFNVSKNKLKGAGISASQITKILLVGRGIVNVDGGDSMASKVFGVPAKKIDVALKGLTGQEFATALAIVSYAAGHCKKISMTGAAPVRETQFTGKKTYTNSDEEIKDEADTSGPEGIKGKLDSVRKLFWKIF